MYDVEDTTIYVYRGSAGSALGVRIETGDCSNFRLPFRVYIQLRTPAGLFQIKGLIGFKRSCVYH